jgi:hypothetical protein
MTALATAQSLDTPPKAPVRNVEDEYFGVKVNDPYRWLEDIKSSPEAQAWLLLDIDYASGHGVGNTRAQNIQRTTDLLSVMLWQLGDPEFQPAVKTESAKKE